MNVKDCRVGTEDVGPDMANALAMQDAAHGERVKTFLPHPATRRPAGTPVVAVLRIHAGVMGPAHRPQSTWSTRPSRERVPRLSLAPAPRDGIRCK